MKRIIAKTLAMALVFVMTAAVAAPAALASSVKGSISVNGTGAVKADPDIAQINLAVEYTEIEAADAQKKVAEAMDKVLAVLKEMGIKDEDIQTTSYSIYQEYDYSAYYSSYPPVSEPKELGYVVRHSFSVTIRDIDKVGEVLDKAVEAGVNQTYGINFSIEDQETFYLEALKLAMENAEKKAKALAKILGVTVGKPVEVIESSSGYVYPIYMDSSAMVSYAGVADQKTSVSTGQVEVTAYVSVKYEY